MFSFDQSVDESESFDDLRDSLRSVQSSPVLLGLGREFVDHRQGGGACAAPFGSLGSQSHGGKGRFDGVCGPEMSPVFGREVMEGEQRVEVFFQAFGDSGILVFVGLEEFVIGLDGVFLGRGHIHLVDHPFGVRLEFLGYLVQYVGVLWPQQR